VNLAFEKLTGYTAQDAIGKKLVNLVASGEHTPSFYQDIWDTILTGHAWQGEIISRRKDGRLYDEELHISPVTNSSGKIEHFIATKNDISERKTIERRIQHMAEHDSLTNLPNRALLSDRLEQALSLAKRDHSHLALMFLDLDKFKPVNDNYGHATGDLLLKEVSERITDCLRESDTVARVGGDEFIILLPKITDKQNALLVAEKIRYSLNQDFTCMNHKLKISSSIGLAIYPEHGKTEIELAKNADQAMYNSKEKGRNNVQVFNIK